MDSWTHAPMGPMGPMGSGPKWALGPNRHWARRALGPNGPWAQTGPGPKQALGPNGRWAQTGPGPNGPWAQMGRAQMCRAGAMSKCPTVRLLSDTQMNIVASHDSRQDSQNLLIPSATMHCLRSCPCRSIYSREPGRMMVILTAGTGNVDCKPQAVHCFQCTAILAMGKRDICDICVYTT